MTQGLANVKTGETVAAEALLRLVFREVLSGDRRKFRAKSNDANSGGGARDFRFSPYEKFDGVFERMLSGRSTVLRSRNGVKTPEEIYTSSVNVVKADGNTALKKIVFEPPTTARKNEGRLTQLNHYGLDVPSEEEGRIVLLLYQTGNSKLWLTFATEQQLQGDVWDEEITHLLLNCLNAPRPYTHAAQGYYDIALGSRFCKAKGD